MPLLYTIHNALSIIYLNLYFVDVQGFAASRFRHLTPMGFWRLIAGVKYIMVCIEKPQNRDNELDWTEWFLFLESVKRDAKILASAKKLTENLWLFPLDKGLRVHNHLVDLAASQHLKYKVFLLEDEPVLCE